MKTPKKSRAKLRSATEPLFPQFEKSKKENARDAVLVSRFKNGDDSAFDELATHYRERLVAFNLKRLGNLADAEDAAQEQLLTIYTRINNGEYEEQGKFGGWVLSIAFRYLTHLTPQKKRIEYVEELPDVKSEQETTGEFPPEFSEILKQLMKELPEKAKKIIRLRFFKKKSFVDIGTSINTGSDTVSGYKSQILKKLNKAFLKKIIEKNTTGFCDFLYIDNKGRLKLKNP